MCGEGVDAKKMWRRWEFLARALSDHEVCLRPLYAFWSVQLSSGMTFLNLPYYLFTLMVALTKPFILPGSSPPLPPSRLWL